MGLSGVGHALGFNYQAVAARKVGPRGAGSGRGGSSRAK